MKPARTISTVDKIKAALSLKKDLTPEEKRELEEQRKQKEQEDKYINFPATMRYLREYRRHMTKIIFQTSVIGLLAACFATADLVAKWSTPPSWLNSLPCAFQPEIKSFKSLSITTTNILRFGNIIPCLGLFAYAIYFLRKSNRIANDLKWKPVHTPYMAALYGAKVILPILLYTAVNFKLPVYIPYNDIGMKTCGVSTSLVFYPPGKHGKLTEASFSQFRTFFRYYIEGENNLLYPHNKDFESSLIPVMQTDPNSMGDDQTTCQKEKKNANEQQSKTIFDLFKTPTGSIHTFCNESFKVARNDIFFDHC
eukprot:g8587.t1